MRTFGVALLLALAACSSRQERREGKDRGVGVREPEARDFLRILLHSGDRLRDQARYSEAREAYERALRVPLDTDEDGPWSLERNLKGWAQIGVAQCYEAEERWEDALAAYRDSHLKYPVRGECGNGNLDQRQRELDSISRCIRRMQDR